MDALPLRAVNPISPERLQSLGEAVARHHTMERVAQWVFRHEPTLDIADVLRQDEFTHDVIVPLPDGLTLVYDST